MQYKKWDKYIKFPRTYQNPCVIVILVWLPILQFVAILIFTPPTTQGLTTFTFTSPALLISTYRYRC